MANLLVFNGDADGICAAHQLRLAGFAPDRVVTGVKRDIGLLERVQAGAGDRVCVADISLEANRAALLRLLAAGARIDWHDHHHAGEIPAHPLLAAHIDTASDTCSSLIVDKLLQGRYRAWAVTAAYGDNLHGPAQAAGVAAGLTPAELSTLRELGELMNYNAYGECEDDLHCAPALLFERIAPYADPRGFLAAQPATLDGLRACFAGDMARARALAPSVLCESLRGAACYLLPDAPWARRVNGVFANELAREHPERAHAVLVEAEKQGERGFMVSLRAPVARPEGADGVCRRAAGINWLPQGDLRRLGELLAAAYP